jgi:hypothetical protein
MEVMRFSKSALKAVPDHLIAAQIRCGMKIPANCFSDVEANIQILFADLLSGGEIECFLFEDATNN